MDIKEIEQIPKQIIQVFKSYNHSFSHDISFKHSEISIFTLNGFSDEMAAHLRNIAPNLRYSVAPFHNKLEIIISW